MDWGDLQSMWSVVAGVVGIGGSGIAYLIRSEGNKRAESAKTIIDNQKQMKDDLKSVTDSHAVKIDRLEQKVTDFRSGDAIDKDISHAKSNALQAVEGLRHFVSGNSLSIENLRDRMARVETQHEQTAKVVGEIKQDQKEMRHEIGERFDKISDCLSEISKKVG